MIHFTLRSDLINEDVSVELIRSLTNIVCDIISAIMCIHIEIERSTVACKIIRALVGTFYALIFINTAISSLK